VGVDGSACAKSVFAASCAVTIWSVAQAFATFRRNALYFNFQEGFSFLKTEKELKMAQFISHKATFFVHFTVFLGRE
jgi:hypothetical protein